LFCAGSLGANNALGSLLLVSEVLGGAALQRCEKQVTTVEERRFSAAIEAAISGALAPEVKNDRSL
jgi:hypothetical protein